MDHYGYFRYKPLCWIPPLFAFHYFHYWKTFLLLLTVFCKNIQNILFFIYLLTYWNANQCATNSYSSFIYVRTISFLTRVGLKSGINTFHSSNYWLGNISSNINIARSPTGDTLRNIPRSLITDNKAMQASYQNLSWNM